MFFLWPETLLLKSKFVCQIITRVCSREALGQVNPSFPNISNLHISFDMYDTCSRLMKKADVMLLLQLFVSVCTSLIL